MRRFKLILEYDGTHFAGFQKQPGRVRTVQGVLEEALFKLTGEKITVVGAGRTDSGVHALGQVVHFETSSTIPVERFPAALNGHLPSDMAVLEAAAVNASFHARYDALKKKYCYLVFNSRKPVAIWRHHCYHFPAPLDLSAMKECAQVFIGEHDFTAFSAVGSSVKSTVRHVFSMDIEKKGEWFRFLSTADGFLYKMMRLMVGTLLEVGRGKLSPAQVKRILEEGKRGRGGPAVPPQGLYLVRVYYQDDEEVNKGDCLDSALPIP
ncbi:MAG TPA: tRNA pseudouridine(38-40) synthase TruA [Syntrophaceticus sp.]|nr:tRNA pseudouridine(38-40) synthase TruA [Syntrophaceticus sp.]